MRLLIVYNFAIEEAHVEAPNFYRSCGEKIFPSYGAETDFLPDLRKTFLFRLLTFCRIKRQIAISACLCQWLLLHGRRYDVIVGWIGNGIIASLLKVCLGWRRTRICLILDGLPDCNSANLRSKLKMVILKLASAGADLLLALDTNQAESFAQALGRSADSMLPLRYGVDADWYDGQAMELPRQPGPPKIFFPGSAYRDEATLEKAVADLDVRVKRFQLDGCGVRRVMSKKVGHAVLEKIYNAPYAEYMDECRKASMVVIAVTNSDKPVGLTSLLECMALGRPVIITRGASGRDYLNDGVTGLMYTEGNSLELREKIIALLNDPVNADRIGAAAHAAVKTEFSLATTGAEFYRLIKEMNKK